MDKDIKLLIKIIVIFLVATILIIVLLIASFYSYRIYQCYDTDGHWVLNEESEQVCTELGLDNCNNNDKCVLRIDGYWGDIYCKPRSGCVCPPGVSYYGSSGCGKVIGYG